MSCKESKLWFDAIKDEMSSMASNGVWDLIELPNGAKAIGYKWVFKTKKDALRLSHMVYGLRVSSLGLKLWIPFPGH